MTKTKFLSQILLCTFLLLLSGWAIAQNRNITGQITDDKGSPIPGASIQVKGTRTGVTAGADGSFKLSVPAGSDVLLVSFIGYTSQEVNISGKSGITVSLKQENTTLTDVVVVGYGTARKKDLTGAVASIKSAEFNKGITTAPDQLIQGKVSGLMVLNNSGAPGAAATVRIRGNASVRSGNQPLYVIDGVPLDGRVARPEVNATGLGQTPTANPLNFVNSFDVASMEVLKDASATAIYGSRGSNGVIMITTKRGTPGPARVDVSYAAGISSIMKRLKVLNGDEYRTALKKYNLPGGDFGGNVDAMDAILRNGITHNINVGVSGGTETSRYRASFGLLDQQGIIKNTGLKKYTANLNGQYKFLETRKLGLDYNIMAAQTIEQLAPITNDAGFTGSLIGQALQWNPTQPIYNADGSINILGRGNPINPVAMSEAYDDKATINYILGSLSPYYKFNDNWEYRLLFSINRQTGIRRTSIASFINIDNIQDIGQAYYGNTEMTTRLVSNTLSFNKQFTSAFNLNAVVGYEYQKFDYRGVDLGAKGFPTNVVDYTDILQAPIQSNTSLSSYKNPSAELQSYFGRATVNLHDKYLLTATLRVDGSSKFGTNNRYGYFPSFAGKWNISGEDFLKGNRTINNLALRVGWGITGNQEFPAGAAQEQYSINAGGAAGLANVANPDLKWESTKQLNAGIDFSIVDNRIFGNIDYFYKNTSNLLFSFPAIQPAPASNYWINLPGNVINNGVEIGVKADIIRNKSLTWNFGVNATFLKNELKNYEGPPVITGAISGQGVSGATSQRLANGYALNTFYLRKFEGLDDKGQGIYADNGNTLYYLSNPNPKTLLGINTSLEYKKWTLTASGHGAYGFEIYNNTANTVLPINNLGSRNVARSVIALNESLSNPITPSSRYLEKGNFFKLDNVTINYNLGNIGKTFKNASVYVTGQNLFVITKYTGFDPEVNTDKNVDGVTSFGIEYSPYPTARNIMIGVLFSL